METELNRIDPLAPARGVVVGAALGSLVWGAGIVAALALCSGCATSAQPHSLGGRLALEAALDARYAQAELR